MKLEFDKKSGNDREKKIFIKHDILTREIYGELKAWGIRNQQMSKYLGNPRLNCVYPDLELQKNSVIQNLPIKITQPFKWLLSEPQYLEMGSGNKQYMFAHAQYESGTDWLGSEIECRDILILLRREENGIYNQVCGLMIEKPDGQSVCRIKNIRFENNSENNRTNYSMLKICVEVGTYNMLIEQLRTYKIDGNGIYLRNSK